MLEAQMKSFEDNQNYMNKDKEKIFVTDKNITKWVVDGKIIAQKTNNRVVIFCDPEATRKVLLRQNKIATLYKNKGRVTKKDAIHQIKTITSFKQYSFSF